MIGLVVIDTIKKEVSMINRIVFIMLFGFLVGSLSFNAIQSEELSVTKRQYDFDNATQQKLINLLHERESN